MKLFSWNINGIRAIHRKGSLNDFLTAYQPDIVGFQEIKAEENQLDFNGDFKDWYKFYNSATKKGYSGTAIYSKIKPLNIIQNLPDKITKKYNLKDQYGDLNSEGRVLTAEFDKFYFVSVYTPNSKGDLSRLAIRQKWDVAFLEFIKQLEYIKPVIFCGDLNVAHQEIDLANPKANKGKHGFTDEERAGLSLIIDNNFVDIFRKFNQLPQQYTWWSYYAKSRIRNVGWRIDYFLASKTIINKITKASIHSDQLGSDHCPISIEIEV